MLRITDSNDEIIVRSVPIREWIVAGAVLLILVSIITIWLFSNAKLEDSMGIIPVSGFLIFFLSLHLTTPATTVKINKPGKTVSIREQNLLKYNFNVYSFSEIADFIYIDSKLVGRPGSETAAFQITLPLKNGKNVKIPIGGDLKDSDYVDLVDIMNPYIFDTSNQIPFKLTVFNDN